MGPWTGRVLLPAAAAWAACFGVERSESVATAEFGRTASAARAAIYGHGQSGFGHRAPQDLTARKAGCCSEPWLPGWIPFAKSDIASYNHRPAKIVAVVDP
jgi:hypothetical protein